MLHRSSCRHLQPTCSHATWCSTSGRLHEFSSPANKASLPLPSSLRLVIWDEDRTHRFTRPLQVHSRKKKEQSDKELLVGSHWRKFSGSHFLRVPPEQVYHFANVCQPYGQDIIAYVWDIIAKAYTANESDKKQGKAQTKKQKQTKASKCYEK